MTPDPARDESHADLLAACDEAIGAGEALPELPDGLGGLARAVDCLYRLNRRRAERVAVREIGRFHVRRELGRGGFGVVYLAFDPRLGRDVALKVPRPDVLASDDLRERFHREARAAAGLDHPNVVPVYEAGEAGPVCYIASAYCPGPTLREWLRGRAGPVPVAAAAALAADLADGAGHAHARGIVHRDLKPANILLAGARGKRQGASEDPEASSLLAPCPLPLAPKITDFGLAKLADPGEASTRSGAVLGTPSYMAPEQAEGRRDIGPPADVYALGVILYELLTGRPPFVGETDRDTLRQAGLREPVPPSRLRVRLPRDLETVCLKCLEKEPCRRYPTAVELAADLRRFLAGEPVAARRVGPLGRAWKRARRRPVVAALTAALVALAGGGTAAVTVLWRQAETALANEQTALQGEVEQRTRVEATLAAQRIALAQREWVAGDSGAARQHLALCSPEYRNREWRYLDRVCNAELRRLGDEPRMTQFVRFSPDGRRLLSLELPLRSTTPLAVWDAAAGKKLFQPTIHTLKFADAAFTATGRHVTTLVGIPHRLTEAGPTRPGLPDRTAVVTYDVETGEEVRRLEHTADGADLVPIASGSRLSPDGRMLAMDDRRARRIRVIDVETGKTIRSLHNPFGLVPGITFSPNGRYVAAAIPATSVVVWEVATGQVVQTIPTPAGHSQKVAFSPDGSRLAATCFAIRSSRGTVRIVRVPSGEQLSSFEETWMVGRPMAVSPLNDRLAGAGSANTVTVWDAATGRTVWTFRGHAHEVQGVTFSPCGTRLASVGWDGTIRIWDVSPFEE